MCLTEVARVVLFFASLFTGNSLVSKATVILTLNITTLPIILALSKVLSFLLRSYVLCPVLIIRSVQECQEWSVLVIDAEEGSLDCLFSLASSLKYGSVSASYFVKCKMIMHHHRNTAQCLKKPLTFKQP